MVGLASASALEEYSPSNLFPSASISSDIASTACLEEPKHYNLTSATGVGVRLVISLLEKLHEKQ